MKKFIFLFIFIAGLVAIEAQTTHTWKGHTSSDDWMESNNWDCGSNPSTVPTGDSIVNIPNAPTGNTFTYPKLVLNANAKEITIESKATMDIGAFNITRTDGKTCKIINKGTLKLEGNVAQKAWFEETNAENKIVLEDESTIEYYGSSTDEVWSGAYEKLKLSRNIIASGIIVNKLTMVEPSISIVSDNQQYKGKVEAERNVAFATDNENATIKFESEVLAKNNGTITITKGVVEAKEKITANILYIIGKSFLAEKDVELDDSFEGKSKNIETRGLLKARSVNIANSSDEWISGNIEVIDDITQNGKRWNCNGVVQAKNINLGASCTNWSSTSNITVEENISADGINWQANSGNISFKKNLTASELQQTTGKVIANGNGLQNIKAKVIKELEVVSSSNSILETLSPTSQTIEKVINSGTLDVPINIDLTITEISNKANATFSSGSEIKLKNEIINEGILTISSLRVLPNGMFVKIEGNNVVNNTNISRLFFENAGGKTFQIKNEIKVGTELILTGASESSLLNVEGQGSISVSSSLIGEGDFLAVNTNVPIKDGKYKTKHSKPEGDQSDIEAGKPLNWIFSQSLIPLTWKGGANPIPTDWDKDENWIPRGEPDEETDVIIPSGRSDYPVLTADVKAKSVMVQASASIDLRDFQILTTSSAKATVSNYGELLLSGTNSQRAWFEAGGTLNKITLEGNSTISYYGISTDYIFIGPYKNLKLSRNITADSLIVTNTTNIDSGITINADNQQYKGRVEAKDDVTFATNTNDSTIDFLGELIAKNTNTFKNITITKGVVKAKEKITANILDVTGDSFLAEKDVELDDSFEGKSKNIETRGLLKARSVNIANSSDEWISGNIEVIDDITQDGKIWNCNGVVQAKNINVGANCTNWTSTSNITVEENISADGINWQANSGNISFKKDLTASELQQTTGKVIANGMGGQSIKLKAIKELEIVASSNSTLVTVFPTLQTIERLTNLGTFNIPANVDLTITELHNRGGANFTSNSEIKLAKEIINVGMLTIPTLLPIGDDVKVEGGANQNHTNIDNLLFESASGKTIEIKNNIRVSQHLKLSGLDATNALTIKGPGKIYLSPSFSDKGKFLHVYTNIPLEGATCITEKSSVIGSTSDIQLGKPENWIFDDAIMPLTWAGASNTSWVERENWRPKGLPFEETEVIIPSNKTNYPLIVSTDNAKAKVVTVERNGKLDLSTFLIKTSGPKPSKMLNNGILRLEGNAIQKAWFEETNAENEIILQDDSVVEYYGSSTDAIWAGAYEKLKLSRDITASGIIVNKLTKIDSAISIVADNQQYKGRVEAEDDVTFATNNEDATIKFENELVAKNTGSGILKNVTISKGVVIAKKKIKANKLELIGESFLAEKDIEIDDNFEGKSKRIETRGMLKAKSVNIATSTNEWISNNIETVDDISQEGKEWKCSGIVRAKNINVGANCIKWTSLANITVGENCIAISPQWNATNGNISIFKDCNAPKLVQSQGALILNGNGEQNLIAKTLNKLEMRNTSSSSSDKMKLQVGAVSQFFLQSGNASLLQDMIVTKEFANNGGVFDALENKKVVILKPIDTLSIKGRQTISGDPNPPNVDTGTKFYQLHCRGAGGKTLNFTNAIEVLYDISTQSNYVPYPNENFTQDNMSLILEGVSEASKLNITGDGQIWFNGTPPYPKAKKGGKFLHVASGVQIRGGCYRVSSGTHETPMPRNWIFEEYAQIVSTLAINGTNEVCLIFSRAVTKPVPDSLKITSPSFSNMKSISVESYPKGSNLTNSDKWFFQFGQNFTPEMLLEKQAVISLGDSSLDFIFENENSDAYPFKKGYVSDIGLNLVNPVLARNTKKIEVFDGTKEIPYINTSLFVDVPAVLDGRTLKLYADSGTSFAGRYWVPNKTNIPWKPSFKATQEENTGAASFSVDIGKSTADTKMFILPTSIPQLKINETVEFMLSYEDLPCARLKNNNDIFSFDLWRFNFIGTTLQRAGVTILNNVINVSRDQQVAIEITTKGAGILTVQIMTLDGSVVKTFVNDYKSQGNYSFYWDGKNEAGRAVARGMYFVRVSGRGMDEVRKVLVTHD